MRRDVGIDLGVRATARCTHDLHFVEEAVREQRADRAVDQAAGQGFQFAGRPSRLKKLPGILPAA
jgi:hypothetical protein